MTPRRPTLRVQAIMMVLDHALKHELSVPEAVEAVRKELRGFARSRRAQARKMRLEGRSKLAEMCSKMADRQCRTSQRIRRLQLEFKSWQTSTYKPVNARHAVKRLRAA